jgi:hypothetical protein
MSDNSFSKERRRALTLALGSVALVPLSSLVTQREAVAGDLPHLGEDDPTAKALSYVNDATTATGGTRKDGQFCKNCNLIQGSEGAWRPCSIFPGKAVNENGWCKAWVGRG